MAPNKSQPIIVIKKSGGHGGHHGGAWKVAYADFVTAMMSLFIVLWLMGSSEKVKKAVAGYFNDPKGTGSMLGTTLTGTGEVISAAASDSLQKLKSKLEEEIKERKELQKLSKQIEITITAEGLRIELIEDKDGTFYQSALAPPRKPAVEEMLMMLPRFRVMKILAAPRVINIAPVTLVAKTASKLARSKSTRFLNTPNPALFTRMSRSPNFSRTSR